MSLGIRLHLLISDFPRAKNINSRYFYINVGILSTDYYDILLYNLLSMKYLATE